MTIQVNYKIDWFSFSFEKPFYDVWNFTSHDHMLATLEEKSELASYLLTAIPHNFGKGRPPFNWSCTNEYVNLFANNTLSHALFEVTGKGCELFSKSRELPELIYETKNNCSRIDLCVDFQTDGSNMVEEFIEAGYSKRFTSKSDINTLSGHSFYIGSRTSERMCRVYQFNKPHERYQNLRVEFELKGERAKQIAGRIADGDDLHKIIMDVGDAYKFQHRYWNLFTGGEIELGLEPIRGKQGSNQTLLWLQKQVAPAFKTLVKEGIIADPDQWLKDNFLSTDLDDIPF